MATLSHGAGQEQLSVQRRNIKRNSWFLNDDDLALENVTEAEIRSGKMKQFLFMNQSGHNFVSSL